MRRVFGTGSRRSFSATPPQQPMQPVVNQARIADLERKLMEKTEKTSALVNVLGALGAIVLGGAFIDEVLNVIVGLKSAEWDHVEGEIISEPVVSYAGAMIKRREVGITYKYFVESDDDDDDEDDDEENGTLLSSFKSVFLRPFWNSQECS